MTGSQYTTTLHNNPNNSSQSENRYRLQRFRKIGDCAVIAALKPYLLLLGK